jgi:hypothetical protein
MNFKSFFSVAIFTFCAFIVDAQSSNQFYTVVVEVPSFSEGKTIQVWKDALLTIDGVSLQEYCAEQGWLVLKVEDAIVPSSTDPEYILRNANLAGVIKVGATASQVEANCNGTMKFINKRTHP